MNEAIKYDRAVVHGDQIASKTIIKACRLDLIERKKQRLKDYPFYFDDNIASEYLALAEMISPQPLALFQKWYLSIINGWRFKSNPKVRRYNNSIFSTARKNAKSTIGSIILVSELLKNEAKGETDKTYYVVASKLSQAELTLRQCKSEIKKLQFHSTLARNFKLNKDQIYSKTTGSYIKALPSRADHLDGLKIDLAVLDEDHSIKDPRLFEVLESGQGQSPNSIIVQTSTTGFDVGCPFYRDWQTAKKELRNNKTDSRSFNALYTQDNIKSEISNPSTWVKSNPLLPKVPTMKLYLKDQINKGSINGRLNSVLVKNLNTWGTKNDNSFIDPQILKDDLINPINLYNRSNVVIGLDLSRVRDLTSVTFTVPINDHKYYTDSHSFVADQGNMNAKDKADGINYEALQKANYVTICKDNYGLIDYDKVVQYITGLIRHYHWNHVYLAFDPWHFEDMVKKVPDSITLIEVKQGVANLTQTISWLYILMRSHRINFNKNNVLFKYAFNNLEATFDIHGNEYLRKTRNSDKIDPVFALVDSLFVQKNLKRNNNKPSLSEELKHNDFTF